VNASTLVAWVRGDDETELRLGDAGYQPWRGYLRRKDREVNVTDD
jgi:hypothetical protein